MCKDFQCEVEEDLLRHTLKNAIDRQALPLSGQKQLYEAVVRIRRHPTEARSHGRRWAKIFLETAGAPTWEAMYASLWVSLGLIH